MEAGPGGAPGPAVISAVVEADPSALAPAPALRLKTEGKSVKGRKTRSNPATPNPVVRHIHTHTHTLKDECTLICFYQIRPRREKSNAPCDQHFC